jgi:hypothetical protein
LLANHIAAPHGVARLVDQPQFLLGRDITFALHRGVDLARDLRQLLLRFRRPAFGRLQHALEGLDHLQRTATRAAAASHPGLMLRSAANGSARSAAR